MLDSRQVLIVASCPESAPSIGGVGDLVKPLKQGPDLRLSEALTIRIDLCQQRWERLHHRGENLLEFWKCAAKRTDSLQVFTQSDHPFCIVLPYGLPIATGETRRRAAATIVRYEGFPTELRQ